MATLGATASTTTFPATAADVGAEASGAVATHAGLSDPHTGYQLESGLAAAITATKIDDLTAGDDNTDLDASTTKHGLLRKLSNTATEYLDGSGAWSTPAGAGGGAPTDAQYLVAAANGTLSAEVVVTAAGLAILDDANAAAQRTTLGVVNDPWTEIVKSVDQTVTNSSALVDDSELLFACVTGGVYHVEIFAIMSANDATGDFKYEIALPTASGWRRNIAAFGGSGDTLQISTGVQLAAATTMFGGSGVQQGGDASDTPRTGYFEMMFRAGGNANLAWRFAEFSAQVGKTATTRAGSVLRYRRLA